MVISETARVPLIIKTATMCYSVDSELLDIETLSFHQGSKAAVRQAMCVVKKSMLVAPPMGGKI